MRLVALLLSALAVASAQSIQYDEGRKIWLLNTRANSYAIGVSPEGVFEALPPRVDVLCPIGAGDALAAAFVWSREKGKPFADSLRCFRAAEARHADIEHDDVGLRRFRLFDGLMAVRSFANDTESRLALQQQPQALSHHIVVIR